MQRECFICTGDLIPNDDELEILGTPLEGADDWIITITIRCSEVRVELERPVGYTGVDPRAVRDLVVRQAQESAQMWLSVVGFVEGASYSTRMSTIEDSAGCIRKVHPRPKFEPYGEDLRIKNAKELAVLVAELTITNEYFRRALQDYVTALNFTRDSPFYLYRALDTLREHFDGNNKKCRWKKMHQSLGTSKSEIKDITTYATEIRHGASLDHQKLFDSYCKHYSALKYVRRALLIFLKNSRSDLDLRLPDLDCSITPNMGISLDKNK